MRVHLVELNLMLCDRLPDTIKYDESRAGRTLINGSNIEVLQFLLVQMSAWCRLGRLLFRNRLRICALRRSFFNRHRRKVILEAVWERVNACRATCENFRADLSDLCVCAARCSKDVEPTMTLFACYARGLFTAIRGKTQGLRKRFDKDG